MHVLPRFAYIAGLTAALLAGTIAPASATAAGAGDDAGGGPNACTIAGAVANEPGITYVPSDGTYTLKGTMDCTSRGEFQHGEVTGKGQGILGCSGGVSQAVLEVTWDNGETSIIETQMGDFAYGTGGYGSVTEGPLSGSQTALGWGREAAGAEVFCAIDSVTSYQFAGVMGFA